MATFADYGGGSRPCCTWPGERSPQVRPLSVYCYFFGREGLISAQKPAEEHTSRACGILGVSAATLIPDPTTAYCIALFLFFGQRQVQSNPQPLL